MPIDVVITLNDDDLAKFQDSIDKGKLIVKDAEASRKIEDAASKMIEESQALDLPSFVSERLLKLRILLNMVRDDEWQLSEEEKISIRGALYYFVDPEDVIPDHIPVIGFLDDAMYAEIVFKELKTEIKLYQEFCQFRIGEENRRREQGLELHVAREDWIADKRAVLHARMRERRLLRTGGRGLRMRLF
ncbi:MAG: YkvA family protein [Pseudohongiellaceae bacterium]